MTGDFKTASLVASRPSSGSAAPSPFGPPEGCRTGDPFRPGAHYQGPKPLGYCAPPPTFYGPEQLLPAELERTEQGQLGEVPLGSRFDRGATAAAEAPDQGGRPGNLSLWKATAA